MPTPMCNTTENIGNLATLKITTMNNVHWTSRNWLKKKYWRIPFCVFLDAFLQNVPIETNTNTLGVGASVSTSQLGTKSTKTNFIANQSYSKLVQVLHKQKTRSFWNDNIRLELNVRIDDWFWIMKKLSKMHLKFQVINNLNRAISKFLTNWLLKCLKVAWGQNTIWLQTNINAKAQTSSDVGSRPDIVSARVLWIKHKLCSDRITSASCTTILIRNSETVK